jgi:hypothetical protein
VFLSELICNPACHYSVIFLFLFFYFACSEDSLATSASVAESFLQHKQMPCSVRTSVVYAPEHVINSSGAACTFGERIAAASVRHRTPFD